MRILHIISGLSVGGAELSLVKLLVGPTDGCYEHHVLSLTNMGPIAKTISGLGVPVAALGMSKHKPNPLDLLKYRRMLRFAKPDVVCSWMYHANIAAIVSRVMGPNLPVVWNIRHSLHDIKYEKIGTAIAIRIGKYLSRYPSRIIYNSEVSRGQHAAYGYHNDNSQVVLNGFDCEEYRPDQALRMAFRAELGISDDASLVGHVARYHPMKGHDCMAKAAAMVLQKNLNAHFVFIGNGVDAENGELKQLVASSCISEHIHLLGDREDLNRIYPALDLLVSSSYGEGFPNVVGEAMSCGVPCVVTDVGESAVLVGDTGAVVKPRDHYAVGKAILDMLALQPENRMVLGRWARKRVQEHYSLDTMQRTYFNVFEGCLN